MISVVIPVLNEAKALPKLLQSLRPLGEELEFIVVDGGSDDGTVKLAANYADKLLEVAPGRASQMNSGAAAASGEWLWFLHADSAFAYEPLAYVAEINKANTWGFFGVRLTGDSPVFRMIGGLITWRSGVSKVATGDQGIFVKRELFNEVGSFDDIPLMEDVALSKTLRKRCKPDVSGLRLLTSSRRWQQQGVAKTVLLMWYLRFLFWVGVSPHKLANWYRNNAR